MISLNRFAVAKGPKELENFATKAEVLQDLHKEATQNWEIFADRAEKALKCKGPAIRALRWATLQTNVLENINGY